MNLHNNHLQISAVRNGIGAGWSYKGHILSRLQTSLQYQNKELYYVTTQFVPVHISLKQDLTQEMSEMTMEFAFNDFTDTWERETKKRKQKMTKSLVRDR